MASRRKRQATRAAQRRRETVLHRLRVTGGIAVGVSAVAGLLYLLYSHPGRHPRQTAAAAAVTPAPATSPRPPSVPPPAAASTAPAAAAAPAPRFDFYTMLPKLKVIVPKTEAAGSSPAAAAAAPSRAAHDGGDNGGVYALQVGSFRALADADRVKAQLALIGVEADIYSVEVDNDTWHRLMVGPFGSLHQLNRVALRLQKNNVDYIVMKVKG